MKVPWGLQTLLIVPSNYQDETLAMRVNPKDAAVGVAVKDRVLYVEPRAR